MQSAAPSRPSGPFSYHFQLVRRAFAVSRGHSSGLAAWTSLALAAASTSPGSQLVARAIGDWWAQWAGLTPIAAGAAFLCAAGAENWRTIRELAPERLVAVKVRGRIAKEDEGVMRVPLTLTNYGHERVAFEDEWTLRVLDEAGAVTAEYRGQLRGDRIRPLESLESFDVVALFFRVPMRPPTYTQFEIVGTDLHGKVVRAHWPH